MRKRLFRRLLFGGVAGFLVIAISTAMLLYTYSGELPSLNNITAQALPQSTKIYARDGSLLDERYDQRRDVIPLSAVSWDLRHATIAIEDQGFYTHGGVNPLRILSAAFYDLIHRRAAQGASTITQQLVKTYVLSPNAVASKSISRKIKEFMLAMKMEQKYSKDQILETYLNTIFYGNQSFGIESASQTYFGKPASQLDLAEASFLAGLPQAPSYYNPFTPDGYKAARLRQKEVLDAMVHVRYATQEQADKAYAEDLQVQLTKASHSYSSGHSAIAPHFVDYVWQELEKRYDPNYLLRGGLRVMTTLDPRTQALAAQAVRSSVQKFSRSYQVNNGAMLVMNPHTGEVLAMVGSADYFNADISGEVNYTTAMRQPGSSFKPYTYVTALLNGWTPASPLDDSHGAKAFPGYPVHDWDNRELGKITLRQSLQMSRNISSVHLFQDVGMEKVFGTVRSLGIQTPLSPGLATTLGASELRMIDHLAGYSAFANGGLKVTPEVILEVDDSQGKVLEKNQVKADSGQRVLPKDVTYMLTDILKGAVHPQMSIPVAAKSGTTSDFKDAWYIGYTTDVAVSAWMGHTVTKPHPANLSMTGYGGGLWGEIGPGSMWHDFMKAYYSNKRPLDWSRPADVISGLLCKLTGQPVPDSVPSDLTVKDIFVKALADQQQPVPCQDPNNPNPDASPSPGAGDGGPSPSPGDGGPLPSPTDILPTPIVLPSPHH